MSAIKALHEICNQCATGEVGPKGKYKARRLDETFSQAVRLGILEGAQTLTSRLFTVVDGVLDGMKWTNQVWDKLKVSSISNGKGNGLIECFFDPTSFNVRSKSTVAHTTHLYLHLEICNRTFIGSTFQGSSNDNDGIKFINAGQSLSSIDENTNVFRQLERFVFHAFFQAIDGNNLLGDHTGNFSGHITELDADNNKLSMSGYNGYDGIFKKQYQNSQFVKGQEVQYCLPALLAPEGEAPEMYFIKIDNCVVGGNGGATWLTAKSIQELVECLNKATNLRREHLFTAIPDYTNSKVNVFPSNPTTNVIGDAGVSIFVGTSITSCTSPVECIEIQKPSAYNDSGMLCDYNEFVASQDKQKYFIDKMKLFKQRCLTQDIYGSFNVSDIVVLVDPYCMDDMTCQELEKLCGCMNVDKQVAAYRRMLPRFEASPILSGTGLFIGGPAGNFLFLTNTAGRELVNVSSGFQPKCGTLWMKTEMTAGTHIQDYNKTISNSKNSPFVEGLHAPQQPMELPHCCPDANPSNCIPNGTDTSGFYPNACVVKVCDGETIKLQITDLTQCPMGGSELASATVELLTSLDVAATPVTLDSLQNFEIELTEEQCDSIVAIKYTVELPGGETKSTTITAHQFEISGCEEDAEPVVKGSGKTLVEGKAVEGKAATPESTEGKEDGNTNVTK